MRYFFKFFTGIIVACAVLEILFRLLPVSTATKTGYFISPSIITYPPHHKFIMASGWNLRNIQHHVANNFGFLTRREFTMEPMAIAVIGDSYVEANMLEEDQRVSAQLEKHLDGRPVYAMGGPGSSLLDYTERARFAQERFGIDTFVFVLERGDVRQALCGSGNIHGPCLDPITFEPKSDSHRTEASLLKKIFRQSALMQYLFSQIRLKPETLRNDLFQCKSNNTQNAVTISKKQGPEDISTLAVDKVFSAFIARLQLKKKRAILVLDSDRVCQPKNEAENFSARQHFMQLAQNYGFELIDLKPIFCAYTSLTGLSLSVSPNDAHWNSLGHELVAIAIANKIKTQTFKN
mgnify:CR=1 FL=1